MRPNRSFSLLPLWHYRDCGEKIIFCKINFTNKIHKSTKTNHSVALYVSPSPIFEFKKIERHQYMMIRYKCSENFLLSISMEKKQTDW